MTEPYGPWRRPGYSGDDIYPPFACDDGMRAGGVNIGSTRQLVHDLTGAILMGGWDEAVDSYGEQACSSDDYGQFLHDLLDMRGEFGRLLLHLAAAVRLARERDDAKIDAHWAEAHPNAAMCDCMAVDHLAWHEDPDVYRPVVEQLRRCLAVLGHDTGSLFALEGT